MIEYTDKYNVGDKVIAISKSVFTNELEKSPNWRKALSNNQPFLFIAKKNAPYDDERCYVCSWKENIDSGDYFAEKDLILYGIDKEKCFEMLLKELITKEQYEQLISTL